MSDLISRQAAIDAIEKAKTARTEDGEIYVAKINAEMNIDLLPSVQEQRWIPVTERLPENDDFQIVTILDESGDTPYRYSDYGVYMKETNLWIVDCVRQNVVAWMPLPEPYREVK